MPSGWAECGGMYRCNPMGFWKVVNLSLYVVGWIFISRSIKFRVVLGPSFVHYSDVVEFMSVRKSSNAFG